MSTFNVYETTCNGEPEYHQNKRDALRAARAEANRLGAPVKVRVTTFAGTRYDPSAVPVRRETIDVIPRGRR